MKRWTRSAIILITLAACLNAAISLRALALPRYTARYEQKCALCHVNPSGGGLRTAYASQKLVPEEIAWTNSKPQLADGLDPRIGKHILVGADFREVNVGSDVLADRLDFFQMQSDLYLGFQLSPRASLYYDRAPTNSYEAFALIYPLPVVYLKAGRFVPAYGWKFDDHTMFVRSELGFSPPLNSDVGFELGAAPGHGDVQIGIVNGNRGSTQDNDPRLAFSGIVDRRFHAGPIAACLGFSGYHHSGLQANLDTWGTYGYLVYSRLTWLGEADLRQQEAAGGRITRALATSNELTALLHQGLDLKVTYDFFDPDRDLASGAKSRWGGGLALMPTPNVVLEALLRRTIFKNGFAYSGVNFYETVYQFHVLF